MREALNLLLEGRSLSRTQAEKAMDEIVESSALVSEQVAAFLVALRIKHESTEEISGFLDCLQKRGVKVEAGVPDLMDVCGTGGDRSGTFNISTTVAYVVAAAGQPVAKHGNRSVSSRSGSFDVLEVLGLRFETDPEAVARSIRDFGIGLLFAPAFHPALKNVAPIRKNLGVHTVFNALGVLMNPARVKRQLIGVYSPLLLEKIADVLKSRGAEEAMIVRGEDGLDELSLCAPTRIVHLKEGMVRSELLRPEDLGLRTVSPEELKGGGPEENARILLDILRGRAGAKREVVLLNSAAALLVGGKVRDLKEGLACAAQAIDSGSALDLLARMGGRL